MFNYAKFVWRILHHKWWVLYFGLKIGGIPLWRLIIHDYSKFSRAEFMPRFRYQILKTIDKSSPEFQQFCDHHHACNAHHWQYWVKNGVPQKMPETFVGEMVVDWIAARKTYLESIEEWLSRDYPEMIFHPETVVILRRLLSEQGIRLPE